MHVHLENAVACGRTKGSHYSPRYKAPRGAGAVPTQGPQHPSSPKFMRHHLHCNNCPVFPPADLFVFLCHEGLP